MDRTDSISKGGVLIHAAMRSLIVAVQNEVAPQLERLLCRTALPVPLNIGAEGYLSFVAPTSTHDRDMTPDSLARQISVLLRRGTSRFHPFIPSSPLLGRVVPFSHLCRSLKLRTETQVLEALALLPNEAYLVFGCWVCKG